MACLLTQSCYRAIKINNFFDELLCSNKNWVQDEEREFMQRPKSGLC